MSDDDRNNVYYQRHDLMRGVEANSEAFLTEPQIFQGAPGPMIVWQMLRGDVYGHYDLHIPQIEAWAARQHA